jgi:hypothetical protein
MVSLPTDAVLVELRITPLSRPPDRDRRTEPSTYRGDSTHLCLTRSSTTQVNQTNTPAAGSKIGPSEPESGRTEDTGCAFKMGWRGVLSLEK